MKKITIVIVILVSFVLFVCFLREALAGGVYVEFEIADQKTKAFADEFMITILGKANEVKSLTSEYTIKGYLGENVNQETGSAESVIGIFIGTDEKPTITVPCKDLFSGDEIRKKAKEAADYIFQRLKNMDEERKKELNPVA